jgi:hypothetical protein
MFKTDHLLNFSVTTYRYNKGTDIPMILSVLYCTIVYLPSVQTTLKKNFHNPASNKSFTPQIFIALQLVRSSLQALQYATLPARTALQAVI